MAGVFSHTWRIVVCVCVCVVATVAAYAACGRAVYQSFACAAFWTPDNLLLKHSLDTVLNNRSDKIKRSDEQG